MLQEKYKNQQGQSLIEITIAIVVFGLVGSAIVSLILGGGNTLIQGEKQLQIQLLTQEAMEAVFSIKNRAWNEIAYSKSALGTSSNQWNLVGEDTEEIIGDYKRIISFQNICRNIDKNIVDCPGDYVDFHSKKVVVDIVWQGTEKKSTTTELTYLTNWDSKEWIQSDWSGSSSQAIWLDETKYDYSDGNIDHASSGEIKLAIDGDGYKTSAYLISSAYNMLDNSPVQIIEWDEILASSTDIQFQIRTSPNASSSPGIWTNWYGANGIDTYFTNATGTIISIALNDNQWMQYRVELLSNGSSTPTLKEIKINYK